MSSSPVGGEMTTYYPQQILGIPFRDMTKGRPEQLISEAVYRDLEVLGVRREIADKNLSYIDRTKGFNFGLDESNEVIIPVDYQDLIKEIERGSGGIGSLNCQGKGNSTIVSNYKISCRELTSVKDSGDAYKKKRGAHSFGHVNVQLQSSRYLISIVDPKGRGLLIFLPIK